MKTKLYDFLFGQAKITGTAVHIALLLLRFYAGYTIMKAGLDKLPLPGWMVEQVVTLGFPFPAFFAWIASFSEFAFGTLLCLGLLTRVSALMLAFTMGVAAFGFQTVSPLLDMHIAQHFFWIYVLFMFTGGGNYSLDQILYNSEQQVPSKWSWFSVVAFGVLLGLGLYFEYKPAEKAVKSDPVELSLQVAGSFNDWTPARGEMDQMDTDSFRYTLTFEYSGPIEFKFTANRNWAINWGEQDQARRGFPIDGTAEQDSGGNTNNIQAYIPGPGIYQFDFNVQTLHYTLDSLKTNTYSQ